VSRQYFFDRIHFNQITKNVKIAAFKKISGGRVPART